MRNFTPVSVMMSLDISIRLFMLSPKFLFINYLTLKVTQNDFSVTQAACLKATLLLRTVYIFESLRCSTFSHDGFSHEISRIDTFRQPRTRPQFKLFTLLLFPISQRHSYTSFAIKIHYLIRIRNFFDWN